VSSTRALLERLPRLADHVRIEAEQAADFLDLLAGDAIEAEAVLLPGIPEGVEPAAFPGWTAALLRNAAAAVAEALGVETAQLLAAAMERAPNAEAAAAAQLDRTRAALERMRRERLLPGDTAVNAIRRYETALDRQLHRALNELEARQDRRAGHRVPLQRVQIHGLPGAS
jgi:hypothetical protein